MLAILRKPVFPLLLTDQSIYHNKFSFQHALIHIHYCSKTDKVLMVSALYVHLSQMGEVLFLHIQMDLPVSLTLQHGVYVHVPPRCLVHTGIIHIIFSIKINYAWSPADFLSWHMQADSLIFPLSK